MTVTFWGAML